MSYQCCLASKEYIIVKSIRLKKNREEIRNYRGRRDKGRDKRYSKYSPLDRMLMTWFNAKDNLILVSFDLVI